MTLIKGSACKRLLRSVQL